jgi:hypothetical protein
LQPLQANTQTKAAKRVFLFSRKKMNKKFSCPSEKRKNTRTHKPTTTLTPTYRQWFTKTVDRTPAANSGLA